MIWCVFVFFVFFGGGFCTRQNGSADATHVLVVVTETL